MAEPSLLMTMEFGTKGNRNGAVWLVWVKSLDTMY